MSPPDSHAPTLDPDPASDKESQDQLPSLPSSKLATCKEQRRAYKDTLAEKDAIITKLKAKLTAREHTMGLNLRLAAVRRDERAVRG